MQSLQTRGGESSHPQRRSRVNLGHVVLAERPVACPLGLLLRSCAVAIYGDSRSTSSHIQARKVGTAR